MNNQLFLLAVSGIKGRKKSNFLLFVILFISLVFTTVTLSITESFQKTNENYRYDTYGEWQAAVFHAQESDRAFWERCGAESIGTERVYGMISDHAAVGTVDEPMIKMGRLAMQEGKFPQNPGEIAMEAGLLSSLGYDYELNQTIRLEICVDSETTEEKTYRLCGVLKHYTALWQHSSYPLVGAVITGEDAEELTHFPDCHYFFTSSENEELLYQTLLNVQEEGGKTESAVVKNMFAYPLLQEDGGSPIYLMLIFASSVIAVICVYLLQLQEQMRSIALFRSIGGTKIQLIKILFYETLCILLPCIVIGVPTGVFALWLLFKFFVKISFAKFYISIPTVKFCAVALLWFAVVFLCRAFLLFFAMRQPLVGRVQMSEKGKRWQKRGQECLTVLLAGIFSAGLLFTILESFPEMDERKRLESMYSYSIAAGDENIGETGQMLFEKVPGVERIVPYGKTTAELTFSGMEHCALADAGRKNREEHQPYMQEKVGKDGNVEKIPFPDGIGVHVTGVSEKQIAEFMDSLPPDFDFQKFISGEQACIVFYTDVNRKILFEGKNYKETGIQSGDQLCLKFYDRESAEETGKYFVEATAPVTMVWQTQKEWIGNPTSAYNVFVSEAFLRKAKKRSVTDIKIHTAANASYLSTDYVVADIAGRYGARMENERERNSAEIAEHTQKLLSLVSAGVCMCLTLLLILWDLITLSAQKNSRSYGILQALGMSKRSMRKSILGKGSVCGIFAVLFAGITVCFYQIFELVENQKYALRIYGETENLGAMIVSRWDYYRLHGFHEGMLLIFAAGTVLLFMLLFYIGNRRLWKMSPIEKLKIR